MSAGKGQGPPKLAVAIIEGLVADATVRESLLGDLAEDFTHVAESRSQSAAQRWYWSQVVRSAAPLSRLSMSKGLAPWIRLGASVIISYVLLAVLVMMTDAWFMRTYRVFAPDQSYVGFVFSSGVISIALGILCAGAAGFFVALIGGRAPFLSAFALGIACVGIGVELINAGVETSPLWYQIGLIAIVTPSALVGAFVLVRVRTGVRHLMTRLRPGTSP